MRWIVTIVNSEGSEIWESDRPNRPSPVDTGVNDGCIGLQYEGITGKKKGETNAFIFYISNSLWLGLRIDMTEKWCWGNKAQCFNRQETLREENSHWCKFIILVLFIEIRNDTKSITIASLIPSLSVTKATNAIYNIAFNICIVAFVLKFYWYLASFISIETNWLCVV